MDRQLYNDRGVIARWRTFLPVTDATPVISLNEGSTPLIYSPRLSKLIGRDCRVFIKFEGLNPTGSFKDRGMTMAISKAVEAGARAVICASTGNTSASAAAYAARAGIECFVLLPAGKIAMGKLAQSMVHGARIVTVDGNFDDALRLVRDAADSGAPVAVVNSINPYRLEGRRRRRSRSSRTSATRRTRISCRWATRGTSPRTGRATASFRRWDARRGRRG